MILATVWVAAFVLAPRLQRDRRPAENPPDRPRPFGYKMAWLAVRTQDAAQLVDILQLREVRAANWQTGLATVYDEALAETHVYVTPPVGNWTFVVGLPLPHPLGRNFLDKATPLLLELGGHFEEVQYYFSYPDVDFFAWARVIEGALVRAFAAGDTGVLWNKGRPTREERSLGLKLFELRGVRGRRGDSGGELLLHPTEDHVMRLAGLWGVDPTRIDARQGDFRLGYLGMAPVRWRPERIRRAA
jgi:hypothetical protein